MDKQLLLKNKLETKRNEILNKSRTCLFENCHRKAIGSHVLQAKGILKNILDNMNHFYALKMKGLFQMQEGIVAYVKKIGIKEGYKFSGFCNEHDNDIFKSIETHPIDFSDKRNLALFTYRTICLELRKKQIYLEINKSILSTHEELEPNKRHYVDFEPAELAIKDFEYYKQQSEAELQGNAGTNFEYAVVELDEKKICFSSPLSIYDPNNELSWETDKYGAERTEPLASSFLNYFPYNGKSYLIVATHNKYVCNWTKELIQKFRNGKNIDKLLSDLLTYRLEFWGMSPEIYDALLPEVTNMFNQEAHEHWDDYAYEIISDFNLFSS